MPRIQILELPQVEEADGTYRTPFVLIIDQCEPSDYEITTPHLDTFKRAVGATAIYATPNTIEIPANDLSAYAQHEEAEELTPPAVRINGDGGAIRAYLAAMNDTASNCPDCHCPVCDHPHPAG